MTIAEVCKMYGMSADTLRYYEKIGLIDPIEKNQSGRREYNEGDLNRIGFLKRMRMAGLSIEALQTYVRLYNEGPQTIPERKELLHNQKEILEKKIQELIDTKNDLEERIAFYDEFMEKRDYESRIVEKRIEE